MGNTPRFKNVALLPEDHERLKEIASVEQRTMTRQLSVIIQREFAGLYWEEKADTKEARSL